MNAMRHESYVSENPSGQNIQSGFIFLQGKTIKVPLFVALVMVWSGVYGCDRWHHRLEAFDRFSSQHYFYFFLANFLDLFKHDTTSMKGFPSEWPSLLKPTINNPEGHFHGSRSCKPDEALLLKIFQVVSNPIPETPCGQNKPGWNL